MTFLYHGSFVSVPSPLTGVGRRELDFGPGFYVTNIREQAERWARRVCVIRAAEQAIGQLRFAKPTYQMCISNQVVVDRCLRFVATETVRKGDGQ